MANDLIEISSEYRNFIAWLNTMANIYINGEKIIREQQTFAANYHELLYNQFFIEYTMGEVGKRAIQEIIETYEMVCRNRQTDKYQNLLANYGEIREYYEFVVGMVADNYLKKSLEGMLEEIDYRIQHEKN